MSGSVELTIESNQHSEAIDITSRVENAVQELNPDRGVNVWVPHTTAGITVNESADPAVMTDLIDQLEEFVPWNNNYKHREGNSAAHVKSVLLDCHQWLPVNNGQLQLGRWQGIFFMEWDGPRARKTIVYED
ncbi:MAG: secondary thiamine-phosphate synthase enzyme YjbQ [bacterium]